MLFAEDLLEPVRRDADRRHGLFLHTGQPQCGGEVHLAHQ
jgi:hypothetical protein